MVKQLTLQFFDHLRGNDLYLNTNMGQSQKVKILKDYTKKSRVISTLILHQFKIKYNIIPFHCLNKKKKVFGGQGKVMLIIFFFNTDIYLSVLFKNSFCDG